SPHLCDGCARLARKGGGEAYRIHLIWILNFDDSIDQPSHTHTYTHTHTHTPSVRSLFLSLSFSVQFMSNNPPSRKTDERATRTNEGPRSGNHRACAVSRSGGRQAHRTAPILQRLTASLSSIPHAGWPFAEGMASSGLVPGPRGAVPPPTRSKPLRTSC
ncbi:uncharacterized protein LY79DRAFT_114402, partial [Colletotrichum navitas]